MNLFGLDFHHLGLAVRKPAEAKRLLEGLGYTFDAEIYDPLQNVNLILCHCAHAPDVEIIYPAEGKTPLDGILNRFQAGIYHLCYETQDLDGALEQLSDAGIRVQCVSEPKAAVLFDGDPVAFYQIPNFGLVEIIHRRPTGSRTGPDR